MVTTLLISLHIYAGNIPSIGDILPRQVYDGCEFSGKIIAANIARITVHV